VSYLLRTDASASGEDSLSSQVADTFTKSWPGAVVRRDLAVSPLGHLDADGISSRVPTLETILGAPVLMALDVRTITPELSYARTMDPLRHLLPLRETSLEESHQEATRYAEELSRVA
jgi:hypothetical protein